MRPGPALLPALGLWLAVAGLASIWTDLGPVWAVLGAVLLAAVGVDGLRLWRAPLPTAIRTAPAILSLGVWEEVRLRLDNPGPRRVRLRLFDGVPSSFALEHLPWSGRIAPGGWAELGYRVRPGQRGDLRFGQTELLLEGPWRLLRRHTRVGEPEVVKVYPNFRAVAHYALLAVENRVSDLGVHLHRRRGEGLEFFQLRPWREGDSLRQVDWKAVARRHAMISREYQDERNQAVIFLLDCGRRMRAADGDLSHFDHALNALLLLSWVALREGDAVGFQTFSGQDRWLPAQRGRGALPVVLDRLYDLQSTLAPSDYREAAERLLSRQRRRALVVLVSNLRDEDDEDLAVAARQLRRRHLVLVVSLQEAVLRQLSAAPVRDHDEAVRAAAAWQMLGARQRVVEGMRQRGVLTLDTTPTALPVALVNRYLDIKRAGLL